MFVLVQIDYNRFTSTLKRKDIMDLHTLQNIIDNAWEHRGTITPESANPELIKAVDQIIYHLEQGTLRVAEPIQTGEWVVHPWVKKAVLIFFRLHNNLVYSDHVTQFYDKVPLRFTDYQTHEFAELKTRIVPPAYVRKGAYLGPNSVLMPSYINIGAYIGEQTMIDTWATVGSCAQIGSNVHISGGVGIGGVLEPLQATPTIIEDNCFIGARSEIVEGVIVERDTVISMGVFIGQSTKIYNRETQEIHYGRVPAGSVVVAGSLPSSKGNCHLNCAVIVKKVDTKTREKVSINELLRGA